MRHLTVQQISGSLDGALSGVSLELVVRHLSSCRECRERHARLTKQDDALRRLLACDFPEVMFDDMFARLGVVLEAESRGEMPPEHALPPELPPLEPERPPSRQMSRPPSVSTPVPALLSEAEQKRRTEAELKAAEAAALSSLEELLRDLNAKKHAPHAPQPPRAEPEPVAQAPEPAAIGPGAPAASTPPEPSEPVAPEPAPPAPPSVEMPRSILVLPPDIVASLRDAGAGHSARAAEPGASEPEPQPAAAPEPAPEPATPEVVEFVSVEEPSLTWVVVEGPLPTGPDLAGALEAEPVAEVPFEPELPGELEREPVPDGVYVIEPEPEPASPVEPEPARAAEPEPERVYVIEPEPVRAAEPKPERVYVIEPEPVRAAEPERAPEPVRRPEPEPALARAPAPASTSRRTPVAPPKPAHTRPAVLDMTPETDPYADYETRLEAERAERERARPRRLSRRHVAIAAGGAVVLLVALTAIGYLPPVIRVPVPVLPPPRLPRIEVVKVPLSSEPRPPRNAAKTAAPARKPAPQPDAQLANGSVAPARVVPPASAPAIAGSTRGGSPREVAPVTRPAPPAREPARVTASEPAHAAAAEPQGPRGGEPAAAPIRAATPARTATPPAPAASTPADEEPVDDGASWPLLCGVVLDEAGSPVAGARVALADLDLGARTDRRGHFCVAAPPGDRTLSVVAAGFATHRRIVSLGAQGLELSISLSPTP